MTKEKLAAAALYVAAAAILLAAWPAPCEETAHKITFSSGWSLEAGEIVSARFATPQRNDPFDHFWITIARGNIGVKTDISDKFQSILEVEGKMWYNTFPARFAYSALEVNIRSQYWTIILNRAAGIYAPFGKEDPRLEIEFGIFPFKYNAQVRNLGEYLFRSGAYPAYLINEFDYPWARLTGLRVSSTLLDGLLHQDFLLTTETQMLPFFDFTPTYIVDCNIKKTVDVGLGFSWWRLFSVDERLTTPHSPGNSYVTNVDTLVGQGPYGSDLIVGDTGYFSFRGIKLMGKLCIDPKRIIFGNSIPGIFGEEDLKLYTEAAILGFKTYPADPTTNRWGYDTLRNKIPVVFGMNLPAFKALDVLSIEFEWYGCTYPNSYQNLVISDDPKATPCQSPAPSNIPSDVWSTKYMNTSDNWKWSVYLTKRFGTGFFVTAQAARDHMRTLSAFLYNDDREEALREPENWWWMVKMGYRI